MALTENLRDIFEAVGAFENEWSKEEIVVTFFSKDDILSHREQHFYSKADLQHAKQAPTCFDHFGVGYRDQASMAANYGLDPKIVASRIACNWTTEQALETPSGYPQTYTQNKNLLDRIEENEILPDIPHLSQMEKRWLLKQNVALDFGTLTRAKSNLKDSLSKHKGEDLIKQFGRNVISISAASFSGMTQGKAL